MAMLAGAICGDQIIRSRSVKRWAG